MKRISVLSANIPIKKYHIVAPPSMYISYQVAMVHHGQFRRTHPLSTWVGFHVQGWKISGRDELYSYHIPQQRVFLNLSQYFLPRTIKSRRPFRTLPNRVALTKSTRPIAYKLQIKHLNTNIAFNSGPLETIMLLTLQFIFVGMMVIRYLII